jgi:ABC-type amino acid transport substrate-binding protein
MHNHNHPIEQIEVRDTQLLAGISKDLQTMPSLFLGGTAYSPGSLATLIQGRIDAANAVSTALSAWLEAVHAYQAADARTAPVVRDLRNWLQAAFGQDAPELADFGFASQPAASPPGSRGPGSKKRRRTTAVTRARRA